MSLLDSFYRLNTTTEYEDRTEFYFLPNITFQHYFPEATEDRLDFFCLEIGWLNWAVGFAWKVEYEL